MQIHDRFDDSQPQPNPTRVGTASRIRSVETVENSRQMFWADAAACILHLDVDTPVRLADPQQDPASSRSVLQRI